MEPEKTNKDVMTSDFSTIKADANLAEAFEGVKKMLEKSPDSPGLIVIENEGNYAGVLTLADFMNELRQLYRDACDKTGEKEWMTRFFTECELIGIRKVSEITSGRRLSIKSGDSFEKACELILHKKLDLLAVVDEKSKPVGIITRRHVLTEIGSRMFK
ncbi:MAG TPA: CBS domain-containing protein [Thermodesulfobacteriota bacterium]|jgi:predicted transcriptional regulator|nr:CBS domain-containing protein [Thermodesulfobacteriota bacterium]